MFVSAINSLSLPYRLVLLQALIAAVLVLGALFVGPAQAGAVALGALAVILPNAILARQFAVGAAAPRTLVQGLVKFVTTAGLIALVLATFAPPAAGFFVGLVGVVLVQMAAPAFLKSPVLATVPRLHGA